MVTATEANPMAKMTTLYVWYEQGDSGESTEAEVRAVRVPSRSVEPFGAANAVSSPHLSQYERAFRTYREAKRALVKHWTDQVRIARGSLRMARKCKKPSVSETHEEDERDDYFPEDPVKEGA